MYEIMRIKEVYCQGSILQVNPSLTFSFLIFQCIRLERFCPSSDRYLSEYDSYLDLMNKLSNYEQLR
jgi:hypothetical protein